MIGSRAWPNEGFYAWECEHGHTIVRVVEQC